MSELKHQLVMTREHFWVFAYPKSEADKLIAELKHDVEMWIGSYEASRRVNARTESELRHQKYKRCLAMAAMCAKEVESLESLVYGVEGAFEKYTLYKKWRNRWLKIAEQFKDKEAK